MKGRGVRTVDLWRREAVKVVTLQPCATERTEQEGETETEEMRLRPLRGNERDGESEKGLKWRGRESFNRRGGGREKNSASARRAGRREEEGGGKPERRKERRWEKRSGSRSKKGGGEEGEGRGREARGEVGPVTERVC